MPGHTVFLQDGEIREGLLCSYCKLLLKDAVQTRETGLRLCKECFEEATRDHSQVVDLQLDPDDTVWPDCAVRKEIGNLKVKCDNYAVGCDWKGLFKQLMQHTQECQYVTVECRNLGCGQWMLKAKMEVHLKEECPRQHVSCKDCGNEMYFIELQDHIGVCPNAPRKCKNCDKVIPASKYIDHIINECERAGCQSTRMFEAFKEMIIDHEQATKRIDTVEKYHREDAQRIDTLEKYRWEDAQRIDTLEKYRREDAQRIEMLEKRNEMLEKRNEMLEMQAMQNTSNIQALEHRSTSNERSCDTSRDLVNQLHHTVQRLEKDMQDYEHKFHDMEKRANRDHSEVAAYMQDINTAAVTPSGDKMVSHEKPSEFVKQLEEKVLEVERVNNILSVHQSELELQLQASLASTHNGAFLWRIPEVRQRIRDAKVDRVHSIYSPPFYTGRNGYKMCIIAYLNSDGSGEGTHLSIFFVLMRGEYDPLLQWPFESKVSLILVDQDHMKHLIQTFKPNPQSCSFQKPKTDMNVASGCPEFADLSILENPSYVKDDVMYIKAIIDTSKILHP